MVRGKSLERLTAQSCRESESQPAKRTGFLIVAMAEWSGMARENSLRRN
jgi:hypothetical protein